MAKVNVIKEANDYLSGKINENFSVAEVRTETVKLMGMKMTIKGYEVCNKVNGEKMGVFSVMSGKLLNLMNMYTFIFVPTNVDAPLFSYDRIVAMGNDTMLCEAYDTFVQTDRKDAEEHLIVKAPSDLPLYVAGERWYDDIQLKSSLLFKGKAKEHGKTFDGLYKAAFDKFIDFFMSAPSCDAEKKYEKNYAYVNGLLSAGGASTDVFVKKVGKDKTEELYYDLIFGIGRK